MGGRDGASLRTPTCICTHTQLHTCPTHTLTPHPRGCRPTPHSARSLSASPFISVPNPPPPPVPPPCRGCRPHGDIAVLSPTAGWGRALGVPQPRPPSRAGQELGRGVAHMAEGGGVPSMGGRGGDSVSFPLFTKLDCSPLMEVAPPTWKCWRGGAVPGWGAPIGPNGAPRPHLSLKLPLLLIGIGAIMTGEELQLRLGGSGCWWG